MQKIVFSIALLMVGFCIKTYAQTPIAKYTFDNGTATDAMGNYNGTLNGVTATANRFGEVGKAVRFASTANATNAFISCGDITQLNGASKYTFAAWINDEDIAGVHGLYGKLAAGNFITTRVYQSAIYGYNATTVATNYWGGANGLTNGTWAHVAVVFDGTQPQASRIRLYINGADVVIPGATSAVGAPAVTPNLAGGIFEIGRSVANHSSYSFRGAMDEVYIYDVALTAAEVNTVMGADVANPTCANFNITPTFVSGAGCTSEMKLTGTANFPVSVSFAWANGAGGSGPYSVAAFPRTFDGLCPENYQTIFTDAIGCTIAYNFTVSNGVVSGVAVGTESSTLQNSVTIAPNPVHDILFVKTTNTDLASLQIMDIMGRTVEQISHNIPNSLDLSDLSAGVYFVRIADKTGGSFVQKIVKQ